MVLRPLFCHHYPRVSVCMGRVGGGEMGRTRRQRGRQEGGVRTREKIRTWLAKGGLKLSPVGRGSAPSPAVWKCVSEYLRREACMLHTCVCLHFSRSLSLSRDPWSNITFNTYQGRPAEQVIKSKQKREERETEKEREASEKEFVRERHRSKRESEARLCVCVCEDSCKRK